MNERRHTDTATQADSQQTSSADVPDADVRRYIQRHPTASVGRVLGRFMLDPDKYGDVVADLLGTARHASDGTAGGVEA